jgi:hypothetical protein
MPPFSPKSFPTPLDDSDNETSPKLSFLTASKTTMTTGRPRPSLPPTTQ